MRYAGFTKQERTFITIMRVWVVLFLGLAILFSTIPEILLNYINDIGKVFLGWQPPAHLGDALSWGELRPGGGLGPPLFPRDVS